MKAQEYFDKYFAELPETVEKFEISAKEMLREFSGEVNSLLNQRNIKTDSGVVGVIREINEKWNSVTSKFEKKHGFKGIKRNVIWNTYLADKFPEFERKGD